MSRLSAKLRGYANRFSSGIGHWCPGCKSSHTITTKRDDAGRPCWTWDGDVDRPTTNPSVRFFEPAHEYEGVHYPEKTTCHYFLRAGRIEFCGDCNHALSGQTVDLPDWPYAEGEYGGL